MSATAVSSNAGAEHYELRGSVGAVCDEAATQFLQHYAPGTFGIPTLFDLISPGDTVTFKVFVHLPTDSQADSNPVTITRQ